MRSCRSSSCTPSRPSRTSQAAPSVVPSSKSANRVNAPIRSRGWRRLCQSGLGDEIRVKLISLVVSVDHHREGLVIALARKESAPVGSIEQAGGGHVIGGQLGVAPLVVYFSIHKR